MNKEEIENKIEEILNKNIVKGTAYTFGTERLKKELIALIQKSNKEAVEDFVDWLLKHNRYVGYTNNYGVQHNRKDDFEKYSLEQVKIWNGYINRNNNTSQTTEKGKL